MGRCRADICSTSRPGELRCIFLTALLDNGSYRRVYRSCWQEVWVWLLSCVKKALDICAKRDNRTRQGEPWGGLWGLPVDHEDISSEIASIQSHLEACQEASIYKSWVSSLKDLLAVRINQKRVFFVISGQILSQ